MPFLGAESALGGVAGRGVAMYSPGDALRGTRETVVAGFENGALRGSFPLKRYKKVPIWYTQGRKRLICGGFRDGPERDAFGKTPCHGPAQIARCATALRSGLVQFPDCRRQEN